MMSHSGGHKSEGREGEENLWKILIVGSVKFRGAEL